MQRMLWAVVGILVALLGGILLGRFAFSPSGGMQTVVNSQAILTALRDQGFLVTQTYVFDQPVTIKKTTGSAFKDFFVGQTIEARGSMEANLGIDLAKLSESDVRVEGNKVTILASGPNVFNTRLIGPIEVRNSQGILKRLLEPDDGYNQALAELERAANEAATRPEITARAKTSSETELGRLVRLIARNAEVTVEWK
ncbi:DUF4230 domain-containing protein [Candidatus Uhrbacteria bacterium]|nr:DUF4230 domain-containing protein [Candidatus Uhrbacteria bacterium]